MRRLALVLSFPLLALAGWSSRSVPEPPALPARSGEVLFTRQADSEAWLSNRRGLVLRVGAEEVVLGLGSSPRFGTDGALYFDRTVDDGHRVLERSTWVLERGEREPRPLPPGRIAPARVAPDPAPPPGGLVRVAVDPGHGGTDPGAVGNGLEEADANLDLGLRLRDLLEADTADLSGGGAWDVLMTREDDSTVSLAQRVDLANAFGAASFLSVHHNGWFTPDANGTETYAWAEGTTAAAYRDLDHARMIEAWGLTDRGTKTANFYVLVNTTMPAALTEQGFVTSPVDAVKIGDPAAQQDAARGHLFALQEHHGFPVHEPGGPSGTLKGVLYDASIGTGARIAGGTVALADGTTTTTDAVGYYEFELPSGTWSFAATAAGFAAAAASETVTTGDVWESVGLAPAPGPTLAVDSTPAAGGIALADVTGDPLSPAFLIVAGAPAVPPLPLAGLGELWPTPVGANFFGVGSLDAAGALAVPLAVPPSPGLTFQLQALVLDVGALRLSNGAGLEVQ